VGAFGFFFAWCATLPHHPAGIDSEAVVVALGILISVLAS